MTIWHRYIFASGNFFKILNCSKLGFTHKLIYVMICSCYFDFRIRIIPETQRKDRTEENGEQEKGSYESLFEIY